jgi:hypothetical protein
MGTNSASKSPLSTKAQPSSFHRNLGIFLGLIAVGFVGLYLLFVSAPEIARYVALIGFYSVARFLIVFCLSIRSPAMLARTFPSQVLS